MKKQLKKINRTLKGIVKESTDLSIKNQSLCIENAILKEDLEKKAADFALLALKFAELKESIKEDTNELSEFAIGGWEGMGQRPQIETGKPHFSMDVEFLTIGGDVFKGYFRFGDCRSTPVYLYEVGDKEINFFQGWRYI